MAFASDGRLYYVLNSERHDIGAQMFVFDPKNQSTRHVADLTEVCGEEKPQKLRQTLRRRRRHARPLLPHSLPLDRGESGGWLRVGYDV